ncbi:hypothetical protein SNEBB_000742, partial [Seison nebaliae]
MGKIKKVHRRSSARRYSSLTVATDDEMPNRFQLSISLHPHHLLFVIFILIGVTISFSSNLLFRSIDFCSIDVYSTLPTIDGTDDNNNRLISKFNERIQAVRNQYLRQSKQFIKKEFIHPEIRKHRAFIQRIHNKPIHISHKSSQSTSINAPSSQGKLGKSKSIFEGIRQEDFVPRIVPLPKIPNDSNKKPVARPRYFADEFHIRHTLLIGIMMDVNQLSTYGIALNLTLSPFVDRLIFFVKKQTSIDQFPSSLNIVQSKDETKTYDPLSLIEYLSEKAVREYRYIMIAPYKTFINGERIYSILQKTSIAYNVYIGSGIKSSCNFQNGIIFSSNLIQTIQGNLEKCRPINQSTDFSSIIYRCLRLSAPMMKSCQSSTTTPSNFQFLDFSSLKTDQISENLFSVSNMGNATEILKIFRMTANLHHEHDKNEKELLIRTIDNDIVCFTPGGCNSFDWPHSVNWMMKSDNRFDILRYHYVNETNYFFNNENKNTNLHEHSNVFDFQEIIEYGISKIYMEYVHLPNSSVVQFNRLSNLFHKFDVLRGSEYIIDLLFDLKSDEFIQPINRRLHLFRPLQQQQYVTHMPLSSEQERLFIILPVHHDEITRALQFAKSICNNLMESLREESSSLSILFVLVNRQTTDGKQFERFRQILPEMQKDCQHEYENRTFAYLRRTKKNLKKLDIKFRLHFHHLSIETTTEKYRLDNDFILIDAVSNYFSLKFSKSKLNSDELRKEKEKIILFYMRSSATRFHLELIERIKSHIVPNQVVYVPIAFYSFSPYVTQMAGGNDDMNPQTLQMQQDELRIDSRSGRYFSEVAYHSAFTLNDYLDAKIHCSASNYTFDGFVYGQKRIRDFLDFFLICAPNLHVMRSNDELIVQWPHFGRPLYFDANQLFFKTNRQSFLYNRYLTTSFDMIDHDSTFICDRQRPWIDEDEREACNQLHLKSLGTKTQLENYGNIYNPLDVAKRENCFTFVLFIDHITNIPEIATVLKVTGTILNGGNDFNAIKANNNQTSFISTFPNLENSSVTQQSFGYRQFININGTEMNEKSLLLLRVYTRHRFTKKLIVLGTTLMSIFTTDENCRDIFGDIFDNVNGNYRFGLFPTFIKNLPSISHMNELNISKFLLNQTRPIPLTQLFLQLYSIDESKKILTDYPKKSNTISDFSKLPPFDGDVYSRRAFTSSFDTRLYDDYTIWMEKNENFI